MLQDSRGNSSSCPTSGITTMSNNNTAITGSSSVSRANSRRMTSNGCSRRSDRNYNLGLSSDIFVTDFDDERTLDEEEAMEGSEDSHNELTNLQKEGDMPLKELLAKYGYSHTSTENSNSSDQLILIRDNDEAGNGVNLTRKVCENDADDFDDEEEEEEDEDDDDDDDEEDDEDNDDEDEEEDGSRIKQKIKNKPQPNLRQFYIEMVKKKKKKRSHLNTKNQKFKSADELGSNNTEISIKDGNIFEMSYKDDNKKIDNRDENNPNNSTVDGEKIIQNDDSNVKNNNSNVVGDNNEKIIRRGLDEDEDEDEDDEEDDDDEDLEPSGVLEDGEMVTGVVSGNVGSGSSRLLRSVSRPQSEEEDDDCDYSPDEEEWKKTIMVGSDYQATIPEGLCRYDDALPYENEDKILWNPIHITEEETEEFLERAQMPITKGGGGGGGASLPIGSHIRDDEQALYLLLQCGYNLEEALRRRRMNVLPPTDAISLWSEEECHNFESGLRTYGKDFHLIQKNKVRTRSVGELVQFYYLWKKTERHDIFTYKARLEKKKYALHPGITRDYMDRFLEEQEGVRDRSSSPNVNNCLLHADAKRQRTSNTNLSNNHCEGGKPLESWDGANNEDSLGDINHISGIDNTPIAEASPTTSSSLLPPPAPPPFITTSTSISPLSASTVITSTNTLINSNNNNNSLFPTPTTISPVNPTSITTQNHESSSTNYSSSTDNNISHLPT